MTHVLIADNDVAVSTLLAEVLVRAGLTVEHAFDGEQARIKARAAGVRVLVCDLDMPRVSGIEVLESLAGFAHAPATVVISGYLDDSIRMRLTKLAFVRETLRKPFDLLAFAGLVRSLATAASAASAETSAF